MDEVRILPAYPARIHRLARLQFPTVIVRAGPTWFSTPEPKMALAFHFAARMEVSIKNTFFFFFFFIR